MIYRLETYRDDRGRIVVRVDLHGFASAAEVAASDAAQAEVLFPRYETPISVRITDPNGRPVVEQTEQYTLPADVDTPEEAFAWMDSPAYAAAAQQLAEQTRDELEQKMVGASRPRLVVPRPGSGPRG